MKRSVSVMLSGTMLAALAAGCASNTKKTDADTAATEKYRILNGSTADARSGSQQELDSAPEPRLNVETRFAAGRLAETQDKLDSASSQYEQALKLNPNHIPSLYRLGIVYTRTRNFEKAVAIWKRYIKATGEIASSYSNLALCYELAGDIPNAEATYKKGLSREPGNAPCHTNYGLMLARQHRITEAHAQLSAVLKPDEVAYDLAAVFEQQGQIAQAKEQLKKALQANPRNTDAQARLARLPQD